VVDQLTVRTVIAEVDPRVVDGRRRDEFGAHPRDVLVITNPARVNAETVKRALLRMADRFPWVARLIDRIFDLADWQWPIRAVCHPECLLPRG
jgi:hypothetical protein